MRSNGSLPVNPKPDFIVFCKEAHDHVLQRSFPDSQDRLVVYELKQLRSEARCPWDR